MAEETLGGKFTIDITNLRAGLNEADRLIRKSESEFRASAAGMENWGKTADGLKKRQDALNKQIEIQKEKIAALIKEKEKVIAEMKKEGKSQEDIDKAIDGTNKQITRESKALDKLKGDLNKTNKSLDDLEDESKNSGSALEKASEIADKASGKFTVMKGALASLVADGFRSAISAAKEFATSMVDVGKNFDSAMAQVSAVSGATGEDLETLRAKAKEMGESTKFTATEAADAFNYMAMAGWKTEDMLGGIDGILNLAAASGADLATTSDIVTDALTAMGYKASDAGRLADVMAAASSNANTNVEMMGATFQYAAPLVGALGYNMEDTAVAIGLMANAGIKGEKAGTALRSIFTRLASPPKAAAGAMEALGISLTDANGKMKPFNEVVKDLRKSFAGLDETQQTQYASALAGQEAMSGLLAVVNASPADFDKLTNAVAKSEGAAQSMADTMQDNLGGDLTVLQSKLEGIKIQIYEKFEPTLRKAIKKVQTWLNETDWDSFGNKAIKTVKNIISPFKNFSEKVLPKLKSGLKVFGSVLKFASDNFDTLFSVATKALTAIVAFKVAKTVTTNVTSLATGIKGLIGFLKGAEGAQKGLNAAMSANVIGAVASALAVLIPVLIDTKKKAVDVANGYDTIRTSTEELNDKTEDWFTTMDSATAELGDYSTMTNEAGKSTSDLESQMQTAQENITQIYDKAFSENRTLRDDEVESIKKFNEDYVNAQKELAELQSNILKAQTDNLQWQLDNMELSEEERQGILNTINEKQQEYNDKLGEITAEEIALLDQRRQKGQISEEEYSKAREEALQKQKGYIEESKKQTSDLVKNALDQSREIIKINDEDFTNRDHHFKSSEELQDYYVKKSKEVMDDDNLNWWDKVNAMNEVYADWRGAQLKFWAGEETGWTDYNFMTDSKIRENTNSFFNWIAESKENGIKITAENAQTAQNILDAYASLPEELQEQGKSALTAIASGMEDEFPELKNAADMDMQTLIDTMSNAIKSNSEEKTEVEAKKAGKAVVTKVNEGVNDTTANANLKADAKKVGTNTLDGISEGLDDKKKNDSLFSKIFGIGTSLVSAFMKSIDSHSPSKAFMRAGKTIPQGVAVGIKKDTKKAINAAVQLGKNLTDEFNNELDLENFASDVDGGINVRKLSKSTGDATEAKLNGGVVVNQYNTYSQAHSRYELYKSKQQTAAAVRLAMGTV